MHLLPDPAGWPECKSIATSKVSSFDQLRTTLAFAPYALIPRKNLKVRQRSLSLLEERGCRQHHLPHCLNYSLRVLREPTRNTHRLAPTPEPSPLLRINTNLASSPLCFGILLFCVDLDLSFMYYLCHLYMNALACFAFALVAHLFFTLCK